MRSRTCRSCRRRTSCGASSSSRRRASGSRVRPSSAEQTVWEAPLEGRIVLVMGSEGEGLARLTARDVRLPRAAASGGQGRLAQRRAGDDRARLRVAAAHARGVVDARECCSSTATTSSVCTPPYRELADDDLDSARVALVSDVAAFACGEWDATVVFDGGAQPAVDRRAPRDLRASPSCSRASARRQTPSIESLARVARERGDARRGRHERRADAVGGVRAGRRASFLGGVRARAARRRGRVARAHPVW